MRIVYHSPVRGLHLHLFGNQGVQHRLRVRHQAVVADQVGDDVAHGPPHVARDQVDDLRGGGGEAQDAQLMVHKDGADAGAGQQVVHVVVGPRQIGHLGLQLGVDRGQFLVDRLQLLLGGLQLLVGGLQFFVDRLHLLVGGFELFVGGLQLLNGGLEIFLLGPQFLLERRDVRINVRIGAVRSRGDVRGSLLHLFGIDSMRLLQDDQIQGRLLCRGRTARRHRADGQVDRGEVAVGFDPQARAAHGLLVRRGFVQGRGQVAPQPFAGHLQDVVDAGLARGRFQVQAGAAVQIEDVALAVDQRAGRGDLLQQRLFGQLAQRQFSSGCRLARQPAAAPDPSPSWAEETGPAPRAARREHPPLR